LFAWYRIADLCQQAGVAFALGNALYTITCHLQTIRLFFDYLIDDGMDMTNPVMKISIRLPKPLPRHLKDDQVGKFLSVIIERMLNWVLTFGFVPI
jgi:site-specific recombinase XerD